MDQQTSVFQSAIELPTLSDTGILAIAMGKSRAVDAIAGDEALRAIELYREKLKEIRNQKEGHA